MAAHDTLMSQSASPELDHETTRFLAQLHSAWSERASSSAYAQLWDELLLQRDKTDNKIAALSTIARIACPEDLDLDVDPHWQELFALAKSVEDLGKKRKRDYHEANRLRDYLIVAALWSPALLVHYGWDKVGQTQMYALRACATQYPRFWDDVCPRLNSVLLDRHRLGIKDSRVKTLNETPIQISRDLTLSALASAAPCNGEDEPWLSNESGNFPLETGGPSLCEVRPHHFRSYLLAKDCFGVLVARDPGLFQPLEPCRLPTDGAYAQQLTSPSRESAGVLTSAPASTTAGSPIVTAHSALTWSPPSTPPGRLPVSLVENDCPVDWSSHDPSVTAEVETLLFAPNTQLDASTDVCADTSGTSGGGHNPQPGIHDQLHDAWIRSNRDFSPLQFSDTSSEISLRSPSHAATTRMDTSCMRQEETESATPTTLDLVREDHSSTGIETNDIASQTAASSISCTSSLTGKRWRAEAKAVARAPARPTTGTMSVDGACQVGRVGGAMSRRSSCVGITSPSTMEETLQSRYRELLEKYAAQVAREVGHADCSQQRKIRAQWFSSTTAWASIWTQSSGCLPAGRALSYNAAEVLYFTSDEFLRAANNGQSFNKPVVIKEKFMDSGMHAIDGLASALNDGPSSAVVEVRSLDSSQPTTMPVDEFVAGIRSSRLDSVHTLNLRNMTNCHQPLFTMLRRFRLLKTLVERAEGDALGGRIGSAIAGVFGCTGFSSLGLAGAFSGPRLDGFSGTWLRNLVGVKLCMLVPQDSMESEWHKFVDQGRIRFPKERQRVVLLERDDVLLLPPGLRVVTAMHSPTNSLMEGGTFWDELNIEQTLESIHWICKDHAIASNPIAAELPCIVTELENLVTSRPDRFKGQMPKLEFLHRFKDAVLSLKELACYCLQQDCDEWCSCRLEGRRCTVWCRDHQLGDCLVCTANTTVRDDTLFTCTESPYI